MGRAFEYRKARKMKRWGHMARVFTKIGKEIEMAVKASGSDPNSNTRQGLEPKGEAFLRPPGCANRGRLRGSLLHAVPVP